jgi:hypothetical protein
MRNNHHYEITSKYKTLEEDRYTKETGESNPIRKPPTHKDAQEERKKGNQISKATRKNKQIDRNYVLTNNNFKCKQNKFSD